MDKRKDIIDLIKSTPAIEPPDDFTARVMARLPEGKADFWRFSFRRPFGIPAFTTDLTFGFRRPVTKTECAFCYILTGIFYLITGFVLIFGFAGAAGEGAMAQWILVQPRLMIAAALWLSGLGGILYLSDRTKMEAAKIATVIYIMFVFLSGSVVITLYRMPVLMASTGLFVISGVVMGILLHQNISSFQKSLHHQ